MQVDRTSEWFVPKFGPRWFRVCVGMLFLPYTGIIVSFAAWGSLAGPFQLERLGSICLIYFLALGVSAHCLDAIGGKTRPWGVLPRRPVLAVSLSALSVAFAIGLYYAFLDSPLLFPIGIIEGFFLFAYNLELFGGRFHNNASVLVSWAVLPIFAGSAIQTNTISYEAMLLSVPSCIITYILITNSRKYKEMKKAGAEPELIRKKEAILKLLSLGVICGTVIFFVVRMWN
ncbi:MAG TPA: hypothetical protein VNK44_02255 [Candidatus Nitrosotenuis sp.]|nr:hypothetical protein [Candidatus Nitrosotenuis sp.]